jgi:transketolase
VWVRTPVAYPHINVKLGATHAGVTVGEHGATHQCNEDIALMRTIPGMTILNPADAVEARLAVEAAIQMHGPCYLRFGRMAVPTLFDNSYRFEIGKGVKMAEGTDVSLIATGLEVEQALAARELLAADGISASVVNIHTIKPLDEELIIAEAQKCGALVTCEEHSIIGGLGSAVAECLMEKCPTPVLRVGIEDTFGRSGPAKELISYFGLDAASIAAKAKAAIALKK